ncbi:MAG: type IX secretion system sortase PorU [Muribaculaceae bacterium]|nr:type IX secretion system sortase PorU [Muribaculaceae bacterium]
MRNKYFLKLASVVLLVMCTITGAQALSLSRYATSSKLSNGHWVKIQIPESGVYELTNEELMAMGFSNPSSVRVYGNGGYVLSEVLDGSVPDDLVQVPVQRYGDKICFYAKGPINIKLETSTPTRFTRTVNPYSQYGYYFLAENIGNELTVNMSSASGYDGSEPRATSLDYCYHEKELTSVTLSGKSLLGEAIPLPDYLTVPYSMPCRSSNTPVIVTACVAATVVNASTTSQVPVPGYMNAFMNSDSEKDTLNYTLSASRIYGATGQVAYNFATPTLQITPKRDEPDGTIQFGAYCPSNGNVTRAYLDYFLLGYVRENKMAEEASQFRMFFDKVTTSDRVELPEATDNLVVWNIDNESIPVQYAISDYDDGESGPVKAFTPGYSRKSSQFIAFDPTMQLMKITGYENVDNQDIHGATTPHMVILTDNEYLEQAQRIAQLHRDHDNMDVLVVRQDQVFNEFSSGTPDAMGVRMMNKMFYDRNKSKFKNFLVLGCGSYDNRGLISNKPNRILTYQSDNSNDGDKTYVCDDFFGQLDDDAGHDPNADLLRIGVGRMPSANAAEAASDVDKLINYVLNPDFGVWRASAFIAADDFNDGMHTFQADAATEVIESKVNVSMNVDKVYVEMYPRATETSEPGLTESKRTTLVGREKFKEDWLRGEYFASYVGHSGGGVLTKEAKLWRTADVKSTNNEHLPIMTTASCDVAQYDSDSRGIAEHMFHKTDGGAIALMTSARLVYAQENDPLNRAFIRNMFSFNETGVMPTLGYAYMKAKQYKGTTSSANKMSFCLLGDPAMKINYPKPYFKVMTINDVDVTSEDAANVSVAPLKKLEVHAQVMKADGSGVNTDFNGDATLSLYDVKKYYKTYYYTEDNVNNKPRRIHYPRNLLAQVSGRVVNGEFTGSVIVPRNLEAKNDTALVRVYAHQDNSEEMVSGHSDKLKLLAYDASTAGSDDVAPEIVSMFFNDELSFSEGATVPSNSVLYIKVTDDLAVNTQMSSITGTMTLVMDNGKKTYPEVKNFVKVDADGKSMHVDFPMSGLAEGEHMLTYTVYDAAGNSATRSITFVVQSNTDVVLSVEEDPAITKATFDMSSDLKVAPVVTLKVTDATGNLVYKKEVPSFPYEWDLKDNNGQKVPAGLYRYFGNFNDGNGNYGGSDIKNLIVIEPLQP